jgi:hypothetical protein
MRIDDAKHWISKTVESTYNTAEATGTNYTQVATLNPFFVLPQLEKLSDAGRSGHTAPTHLCNHYWSPGQYGFADDAETDLPARLFRRALGGSVTDTLVETGVYDHTFAILPPQTGSILPSFGMASLLDVASFLLHGCMVERFKISQKTDQRAQYESDIVNSGKFTRPHGLTSLPELAATVCMDAFRTSVTYQDSGTVDFGALGTMIEWMVEHKNNIKTNKRRIGDTIQTESSGSGAHVRRMPRGKYETAISMLIDFVDLAYWTKAVNNVILTDLKFKMVGPTIGAVSRHEFEIIVPRFSFQVPQPGEDDGDAATPITVVAIEDTVSLGTITGRIRNGNATLL